jgi:UDP-3-O-[3-hydroxymyristoyl] glucosamine N-acyltransferase
MILRVKDFSDTVHGTVFGDPDTVISGVSGIRDAEAGDITFLSSPKYLKYAKESKASCIIVKEPVKDIAVTQLKVANPSYAFARAIELFYPKPSFSPGIRDDSFVSGSAVLGHDVSVFPFAYISDHVSIGHGTVISQGVFIGERTEIGNNCYIHPNVTIREDVRIGDNVVIHSGTVIGSDGFGYVFEKGEHYKIPQVGGVIIGDDVEIGSNVSIDRATIGNTVVGRGTKIDNLVQIGHNVKIGEKSLLVAQVAIGGSSEIGSFVTLAGQVGIADHTSIESGTIVGAKSGLAGHIAKGIYSGSPAIPHKNWLRSQALYAKLPEMNSRIRELEMRLNKLEKGAGDDDNR